MTALWLGMPDADLPMPGFGMQASCEAPPACLCTRTGRAGAHDLGLLAPAHPECPGRQKRAPNTPLRACTDSARFHIKAVALSLAALGTAGTELSLGTLRTRQIPFQPTGDCISSGYPAVKRVLWAMARGCSNKSSSAAAQSKVLPMLEVGAAGSRTLLRATIAYNCPGWRKGKRCSESRSTVCFPALKSRVSSRPFL
jgi:hypothetical protein